MRRASRPQVVDCPIKRLTRDKHRRGKPVREGESWTKRQREVRRAQSLLAPAYEGVMNVMTPVVRFQPNGLARCGRCLACIAVPMQHEGERAPCVA